MAEVDPAAAGLRAFTPVSVAEEVVRKAVKPERTLDLHADVDASIEATWKALTSRVVGFGESERWVDFLAVAPRERPFIAITK